MLPEVLSAAEGNTPWRKLGKIKLGIKVQSAKKDPQGNPVEYPKDVDYFVVPPEYQKFTGDKPKELHIVLMQPTLAKIFDTRRTVYNSNGSRFCHSADGKTARRYMKVEGTSDHADVEIPCPGLNCQFHKNKKCQDRGYLSFRIASVPEIGEFAMIFGSKVAQAQILKSLQIVEFLTKDRPMGMYGIRMKLVRVETTFYKDLENTGQKKRITKFIPNLEIDYNSLLASDKKLLGPAMAMPIPMLPAELDADAAPDDEEAAHSTTAQ